MAEPPLHVEPDGLKPELRRSGHRWIDLVIAATAILLSLISLKVAVDNARTQEKMVAASSWPILFFSTGNQSDEGPSPQKLITLTVRNDGAGPALVKHVGVHYRERALAGSNALIRACCVPADVKPQELEALSLGTQRIGQSVIPPGGETTFIYMPETPQNAEAWAKLNRARFQLKFDVCYCSVLGECWRSDLSGMEPREVDQCPAEGGYRE